MALEMKLELITASEKRRKYESAENEAERQELEMIVNKLNFAPGLSLRLTKQLSKPVEKILTDKGYKCGWVESGRNESDYIISW